MPPIRSVTIYPDAVVIISHFGETTITRANIPPNILNKTPAEVEAYINTIIEANQDKLGCYVAVHIFALNPQIIWTWMCSDYPIPDGWWMQ